MKIEKLPENILFRLNEIIDYHKASLVNAIEDCESPIEMIMAMQLYEASNRYSLTLSGLGIELYGFVPQATYDFDGKKYRSDFSAYILDTTDDREHGFIIECDGHDFHEKTKEQAQRDKERDRLFTKNGYTIIHFTGSEIVRRNCGEEVFQIILKHFENSRR